MQTVLIFLVRGVEKNTYKPSKVTSYVPKAVAKTLETLFSTTNTIRATAYINVW
jgi:small basic protein